MVGMLSDRSHPRFRNFNSTAPVDVVRVKSYVNRLECRDHYLSGNRETIDK